MLFFCANVLFNFKRLKLTSMIKHALTLFALISLLACFRANAGQEDVDKLLTMDEAERGSYIAEMREFVNANIDADSKAFLCMTSKKPEYKHFRDEADFIRSESSKDEIKILTYAELAFYVKCDEEKKPLYKNIHPDDIYYTADGLSETTLEMIRAMGPLLLAKGPDGKTALEHVEDQLTHAQKFSDATVQEVYASIKAYIEMAIDELDERGAVVR